LRHDALLKTTLEGQIQGKKGRGRPRTILLDWLLKMEEATVGYEDLKMLVQERSSWRHYWQKTTAAAAAAAVCLSVCP